MSKRASANESTCAEEGAKEEEEGGEEGEEEERVGFAEAEAAEFDSFAVLILRLLSLVCAGIAPVLVI